jgi:hypothetical protein
MRQEIPYGVTEDIVGLKYFNVEISYAGQWVSLNDGERFRINAEATRDSTTKTWRKTIATSPVLGGDYLIHAVPEMVQETIGVWVHGGTQVELGDNYQTLTTMFEQYDFRLRWTFNEYREYWRCQLAESTSARGHVWTHNNMASVQFTVPRFPNVTTERVE